MTDILEGSKQLLDESISLLDNTIDDVIIVGGWGPYLRHSDKHPGTKDVDILFPIKYDKKGMLGIMNRFLDNGFFISAKNDFQLCRAYKLGNQTYIYNVDLLHATEGKLNKVDFVEIMNLDVTDGIRVKPLLTINIMHGKEIYSETLFETIEFNKRKFNVLDAAGIIISKIDSCHNKKRQRDIYDIYLSLSEPNAMEKVTQLINSNYAIKEEFEKYANRLKNDWDVYEGHLKLFGVNDPNAKEKLIMGL